MNPNFWTMVAYLRDQKESLAGWKKFLGAGFEAVRPMLRLCPGEYCQTYPDPQGGCMTEVASYQGRWRLNFDPDSGYYEREVELTEADVQLYRLDGDAFRERVRSALGILGPSDVVGPRLECVGNCTQGPKRRRVYLCHARDEGEAMAGAQEVITRAGAEGCVLLPKLSETVDRMLTGAGVSGVHLSGSLTLTAEAAQGGCGIVCRHLQPRDLSIRDLKGHLDQQLGALGEHVTRMAQENDLLKQGLAKALGDIGRQVEPEFLTWIFTILGQGSVSGAARSLDMPKSSFDQRLKEYVERGGLYRLLYSIVAIRRQGLGQKPVARFDEMFARHQPAATESGPALWRDLIDGLESLNASNWQRVGAELIALLRGGFTDD